MAEPLSLASIIVRLYTAGAKLYSFLGELLTDYLNSAAELNSITSELFSLNLILLRLLSYITTPHTLLPHTLSAELVPTLSRCMIIINEIKAMLLKIFIPHNGNKIARVLTRFRWMRWLRGCVQRLHVTQELSI
ncbi:hypothetical protein BDZ91DRAFT_134639 [Kalaharituber pfeilii]|nr:hypothetical protein BDZ91DRAFT_134639 [Kalaharituber pfeilii]